jgi:hypothetical protein
MSVALLLDERELSYLAIGLAQANAVLLRKPDEPFPARFKSFASVGWAKFLGWTVVPTTTAESARGFSALVFAATLRLSLRCAFSFSSPTLLRQRAREQKWHPVLRSRAPAF